MKEKAVLYLIALNLLVMSGCSRKSPTIITALSEKDNRGNYTLKWEIFPEKDNVPVEIYASGNDTVFSNTPLLVAKSDDYIAVINRGDSLGYRFFKLKVDGVYSDVITNRFFELDSVQNFRDVGGYHTINNKFVRWGKIYRSGDFSRMTQQDAKELERLKIKSIIDLRSRRAINRRPDRLLSVKRYELPMTKYTSDSISRKIVDGTFLRGDAIIYTQDWYRNMIDNYSETFAQLFDYLSDESNYPLVYHCSLGKDQSGMATYFLLRALDVPVEVVEEDYMLSNEGVNKAKIMRGTENLSESRQEALTMMTKTDLSFLKYALSCIRSKSGSVEEYMEKELRLTPEKKQKLKKILLY